MGLSLSFEQRGAWNQERFPGIVLEIEINRSSLDCISVISSVQENPRKGLEQDSWHPSRLCHESREKGDQIQALLKQLESRNLSRISRTWSVYSWFDAAVARLKSRWGTGTACLIVANDVDSKILKSERRRSAFKKNLSINAWNRNHQRKPDKLHICI